jgi:DNA-binding CsgD family transcriptional regulator
MDSPIEETDIRAIVRILGHVAAMKPSPDRQRKYLMGALAKLLGTDTWVWGVAPLLDPEKQPVYVFRHTGGMDEERMSRFLLAVEHPDTGVMTAPLAEAVAKTNSQVTRFLEQIIPLGRFRGSPAWEHWKAAGIGPILITIRPVPGYGISCIGFYRPVDARAFGEREARIAHIVLSEVPLLHEAGMPHAAARTLPQLPPRCRLIINQLVRGMSRHDIAAHLGLSPHTVHDYVKRIFQHFSVHSQSELIARLTCGDGMDR